MSLWATVLNPPAVNQHITSPDRRREVSALPRPAERRCRVGVEENNTVWVGRCVIPSLPLLHTRGERWLRCWCSSSASGLCSFPPTRRGLTINSPKPTGKEWTWPWRSSTPTRGSSTISASSEVSTSPTSRYCASVVVFTVDSPPWMSLIAQVSCPLCPQAGFDVTYIYHHFYLKATKCPRGTVDATSCRFRNDRVRFVLFSFAETFFL